MKLVHGSTFSGIGGPELAAEMLGWENAFHCEINPFGRTILDYYYPNAKSYEDITTTDFSEWRGKIDILTGGFPCQPFSLAGRRGGATDDRYLWPYMLKCIDQIRPTWFVGENVAGILTMVLPGETTEVGGNPTLFDEGDHISRTEQRYVIEEICHNLESIGYSVQPMLVPACAIGAPHRRDRVFFIAHNERDAIADTHLRHDRAITRNDGCKEKAKRLQERHDVCQSSGIRPESCGAVEDPMHIRCQDWNPLMGQATKQRNTCTTSRDGQTCRADCTFDSCRWGGAICNERKWRHFPTQSPVCRGNDGIPFDVDCIAIPWIKGDQQRHINKWREESLKAYGNAIVPQVMYEIFKAIDMTYEDNRNT